VRRVPAKMVMQTALSRIEESPSDTAEATDAGCGCADPSESSCAG